MNIYILLAHPDSNSFNGKLADAIERTYQEKGHSVRRQNLGNLQFDPILWKGYGTVQPLEPDLQATQDNISWCNHWVIIYPVWWGSVPALLKGFLDRVLLPGFAFKYHQNDPFWDKYLKNKAAHLVTTSDAPSIWLWWQYGNSDLKAMKKATLEFCGFKPVHHTRIGRVKYLNEQQRKAAVEKLSCSF